MGELADAAELVRETCAHGRALVQERQEEGSEAADAAIALCLRGAFLYFDSLVTFLPPDPPRPRPYMTRV